MNAKQVLAKILEGSEDLFDVEPKVRPALHIVRKPEPRPAVKRVPFNEQRRAIRALLEEGWLKPYYQVYLEIDGRMDKPERLPYEEWVKDLSKSYTYHERRQFEGLGFNNESSALMGYGSAKNYKLKFWSSVIRDTLEMMPGDYYRFAWGNAKFNIKADLEGIYTFWKALNKKI